MLNEKAKAMASNLIGLLLPFFRFHEHRPEFATLLITPSDFNSLETASTVSMTTTYKLSIDIS